MNGIIDAHQHFWDRSQPFDYRWLERPGNEAICRDFGPADLKPHLEACGVSRSIFVQTQHNLAENRWALGLAETNPWIVGVVGWVDLASPKVDEQLAEFRNHPKFVGVRHITQDEPDDDFLLRPDVLRGLRVLERHGVPFDLLFYVKHLKHAATLAAELPSLPMTIDHLAKPKIKERRLDDWLPHLEAASKFPNIVCKLSGLITEADWRSWKPSDLTPYLDAALELFGPSRLMYGSDWPVCELAGSYEQVFDVIHDFISRLSVSERTSIWSGAATKFYGLAERRV